MKAKNPLLIFMSMFLAGNLWAQSYVSTTIESLVDCDKNSLIEIFKDIHQNPELGFMETRTAGIVNDNLKSLGFYIKTGIAVTGLVEVLQMDNGKQFSFGAHNGDVQVDLDAFPLGIKVGATGLLAILNDTK